MKNLFKAFLFIAVVGVTVFSLASCASIGMTTVVVEKPFREVIPTASDDDVNYVKVNEWMVDTFNSAESVIQFSDKEAGVVKGKYLMRQAQRQCDLYGRNCNIVVDAVRATVTVRCVDGEVKVQIAPSSDWAYNNMYKRYAFTVEDFMIESQSLSNSLKIALEQQIW